MKCPTCPEATLIMSERQGIEIDYCPQCRGVWLDRGELDKIIERASPPESAASATVTPMATPSTPIAPTPSSLPTAAPRTPSVNIPSVLREVLRGDDRDRYDRDRDDYKRHRDYDDDDYKRRKRKKSGFLGEIFDFD